MAKEEIAQARKEEASGDDADEQVAPQFRAEAKSYRDYLPGTKAAQLRPLLTLVRRRGRESSQEQLLDLRKSRGRAVLLTGCSLDDLRESENDGELRLHVEELNELQQRFRDSLQIVVLQSEHKGKLWRKRSRAEKAQALRQTRQAMETLDVEFQMSRPLAVDGPDTLALLKHLKAQSQNPLDIGSKFSTYFVLDATGCFHCRRSGIFPMQLEAELESLCCVTGLFSYVESADQA